ncbi:hypothetical protein F5Y16DRAFT_228585 [Xylariaceae sp. FL0255]|nr:hypothetical protein F5Y16DRAFT_228585 [Xylariaceae sp. FL0255]
MPSTANRPFTTVSHVHPSHLPALYKRGRMEKKLATATVAAVGIGYGVAKLKEYQTASTQGGTSSSSSSSSSYQQAAEAEAARRRHAEAMMDAYSDRSSLAELEAAVRAYESHHQSQSRK